MIGINCIITTTFCSFYYRVISNFFSLNKKMFVTLGTEIFDLGATWSPSQGYEKRNFQRI